MTSWICCC